MTVMIRPDLKWVTSKRIFLISGRAIIVIGQWLFLLYALQIGNPALVKTVSDTSPLFVILIVFLLGKEKITVPKIIGSIAVMIGLVLIS